MTHQRTSMITPLHLTATALWFFASSVGAQETPGAVNETCRGGRPCGDGLVCHLALQRCFPGCSTTEDCTSTEECVVMGDDHLCVAAKDENGNGGLGYPCGSGEVLCQDSLVCTGSSTDDAACQQFCNSVAECAPGDACTELISGGGYCLVRGSSSEGDECVLDLDCNSEDLFCLIDDNDGGAHCYIQCGLARGCPADYQCTPLGSSTSYCAPPALLPDVDAGPTLDAEEVDAGGSGSTGNTANDGASPDTPVDSGMADDNGSETGGVRGPCYGNGTCNAGLTCISEVCVEEQPTCRCVGTPSSGASGLLCFIGALGLSLRRRRQV